MTPHATDMKALVLTAIGTPPEVTSHPRPEPGPGEVRVRIGAASVNGFDLGVVAGYMQKMMEHRFPLVLGKDFAGTVDAVGSGVTGFAPGDRVFGEVARPYIGDGTFAEYVVVSADSAIAPLPEAVRFQDGGSLGIAGTTARMSVDAAQLQAGQTVLIVGATGGVGTLAIQLAAQAGARVIATAHGDEARKLVESLGASEVIDHTQDLPGQVRASHAEGVDAVVHLAGDPAAVLPLVRTGGRFVSTMLMSPDQLPGDKAKVVAIYHRPTREMLEGLASEVVGGRLRVPVQRTYPLSEAPAALRDFAGPNTLGKLVITID